jgi:hypothetical protein
MENNMHPTVGAETAALDTKDTEAGMGVAHEASQEPTEGSSEEATSSETVALSLEGTETVAEKSPEHMPADFHNELLNLDAKITDIDSRIAVLESNAARDQEQLNAARLELGLPAEQSMPASAKAVETLTAEKEKLEKEKEEAATGEKLNEALGDLSKLPPEQLVIVIATGKMPDGSPVKTKDGKELKPDVAKKLAELAKEGVKQITKAVLMIVIGIAQGVASGVFAVVGGEK